MPLDVSRVWRDVQQGDQKRQLQSTISYNTLLLETCLGERGSSALLED